MLKKEEIAVKLTKKNTKKVYKILKMFSQRMSKGLEGHLSGESPIDFKEVLYKDFWDGTGVGDASGLYGISPKNYIKPKQLKQILAVENLKKGDVFIGRKFGVEYLAEVDKVVPSDENYQLYSKKWYCFDTENTTTGVAGYFNEFIRYATEEEKQLLKPCGKIDLKRGDIGIFRKDDNPEVTFIGEFDKMWFEKQYICTHCVVIGDDDKGNVISGGLFDEFIRFATDEEKALFPARKEVELEIGQWYKQKGEGEWVGKFLIFCFNGTVAEDSQYGFNYNGDWVENISIYEKYVSEFVEVSDGEIQSLLLKEAKKRGYGIGVKIRQTFESKNDILAEIVGTPYWATGSKCIAVRTELLTALSAYNNEYLPLMKDGKWAEIVKTVEKDVWVNIYSDGEEYVYLSNGEAIADSTSSSHTALKGKLTYEI